MIITEEHIFIRGFKYDRKLVDRIINLASSPFIENIVIDGFSGVGGVTEGFSRLPNYIVIACINHWDVAIATHEKNHPDCLHLLEDFRTADIGILQYMVLEIQKRNPEVKLHLWLSLECTNFSNAKGGMSRDADSRTLADHADRYVTGLSPDVIWIENVKEFQLWGPMIPKVISTFEGKRIKHLSFTDLDNIEYYNHLIALGHVFTCPLVFNKKKKEIGPWMIPCPIRKGEDYNRWKAHICSFGYGVKSKLLNCADFGIPQHRIRLIMQFNREGMSTTWPLKTHDKKGANGLPKWKAVRTCLDLNNEGESVLSFKTRKGQLVPRIKSPATIKRLMNGCDKHVLGKKETEWIVKPNSAKNNTDVSSGASVNSPSSTVTCFNGLNLAKAHMIDHYFGNGYTKSVQDPAGVSGTKDGISLHSVQFLSTYHSTGDGSSVDDTAKTIMTKDKYPLVSTHFMDMQYSQGQQNKSVEETAGAVVGVPKNKLVEVERFLMDTQFNNGSKSLDDVSGTQTASRKHFYLVNFQWFNQSFNSIDNASNTIIARMDKSPNYLVVLETGELAIEVFEHDPPHYVQLKKYMAENGIISINMRMLNEVELLKIMTMNPNKKLSRSSTNNKKMIGNAVPSDLVEQLGASWKQEKYEEMAA
jgi:DNA (cytosine-5)-methyltransferase 1